ncbi:hypothetical protein H9P43_009204 [Blastocladiella emersonii ATCC 22665]|nr:hypothetical protein H9P43_009204 [Blastocladiella emersonii ATCC 22665]
MTDQRQHPYHHPAFNHAHHIRQRSLGALGALGRLGSASPILAFARHRHDRVMQALALSRHEFFAAWHRGPCTSLALDPLDDRFLISTGLDCSIALWDTRAPVDDLGARRTSGRLKPIASSASQDGHKSGVTTAAWYSVDAGLLVSGSADAAVIVWDASTVTPAARFEIGERVHHVDLSPDALIAVGSEESHVRLCDIRTGSSVQSLRGHKAGVKAVQWMPHKDHHLVSGGVDGTIRLWDVRQGRAELGVLETGPAQVIGVTPSADGAYVVAMTSTGRTQVWVVEARELVAGIQTAHRAIRTTQPVLTTPSVTHPGVPGYFIPSGDAILSVDLLETEPPTHDGPPPTPRARYLARLLSPCAALAWSARRGVLFSSCEDGAIVCWDTRSAAAARQRKRGAPGDDGDNIG